MKKNQACILLGSNIEPVKHLKEACIHLEKDFSILGKSSIWRTAAIGSDGPDFLNTAVILETTHNSTQLKELLNQIEQKLGRVRVEDKFAPRTIDLDILTFNGSTLDPNLFLRAFAAVPASELIPDMLDPISKLKLSVVAEQLKARSKIQRCNECLD